MRGATETKTKPFLSKRIISMEAVLATDEGVRSESTYPYIRDESLTILLVIICLQNMGEL
jgi:hypothetical protein